MKMSQSPRLAGASPANEPARRGWRLPPVTWAVMTTTLTLLAACGGGGGGTPASPAPTGSASSLQASRPGELLAHVKTLLQARGVQGAEVAKTLYDGTGLIAVPVTTAGAPTAGGSVAQSNTTVQEAGVEEEDLIKSDGKTLYTLSGATSGKPLLNVHARGVDGKLQALQTLSLPFDAEASPFVRGMLLATTARRLAVSAEETRFVGLPSPCPPGAMCIAGDMIWAPTAMKSQVHLATLDLAANGTASLGTRLAIDGRLVGTRQIGNLVYLVTTYSPQLAWDALPATATVADREAALAKLSLADVLPSVRVNGGAAQPLVAETDCYVQPKNASLAMQVTTVTAIDLGSPTLSRASRCFVGGTEAMYMSTGSLYLATTRTAYAEDASGGMARIRYVAKTTTDVHKFTAAGTSITYRGSGEVPGHLGWDGERKPYRLSEHNGDLRVLSFTGEVGWAVPADADNKAAPAPSPATLTILRERASDQSLQVVGQLPNTQRPAAIGLPGEQVYAVRMLGERGYVVTFRQVDPLFVLDLSNPADPKQAGELKVPGFSDYLFPMGDGLLFGVGKDADASGRMGGVKVALFDVKDPAKPAALASLTFGQRGSATALDASSHGINLFQRGSVMRIALPMTLWDAGALGGGVVGTGVLPAEPKSGLQRLEVDLQARTLVAKPLLPTAVGEYGWIDLSAERSLQIEDQVYYLSQGKLNAYAW